MQLLQSILLALHILGLAAIIGTFLVQMRKDDGFAVNLVLGGAITQVLTGIALVGVGEAALDRDYNMIKIGVKLVLALVVLGAAIAAVVAEKRGARVKPWFHVAGGTAIVNVLVAVIWR
ncbi:MAG: hypothetical protein J0H23_00710 [Micrococcales bacterium]|nr:hypothetical protein [Micrococcales bacterium]OJX66762.1 MAG: hypothetical protein BGO94_07960 [Micrococcales bacterium 72-143]